MWITDTDKHIKSIVRNLTKKKKKFISYVSYLPSSGYSKSSTFLMQFSAKIAAGPPIEPK